MACIRRGLLSFGLQSQRAFSSDGASLLKSARAAVSGKMDAAKNALSAAPNGHVQKATDAPSVSPKTVQVAKTDLDVAQLVAEASSSSSSSIRSSSSMEALETYTQPKLSAPPVQQQQHFSMPNQTEPKPLGHFHEFSPKITVIGVGGAGGNAVSNMVARDLQGVEFTVCNTDAQHLSTCLTDNCIQLGRSTTQGLGCGANPDAGKMAALESRDEIMEQIEGSHMVFITAGMGGGTGTGAAPVIAETCLDAGILTVAVVTQPFRFEGKHRARLALEGLETMEKVTDTLIVIPNQNIFQLVDQSTSLADSFRLADDVLLAGVRSVTDLMVTPGLINLDFADVQSVMKGMGTAMMGSGQAEGEERSIRAAEMALHNPLLGDISVKSAKGMLVNITGGADMTLFEVDKAAQKITEEVTDESANIIFGSAFDSSMEGQIRVSIVATGIEEATW